MKHLAQSTYGDGRGEVIIEDVAVPRSAMADLCDAIVHIGGERGVVIGVLGHAGDGNLHPKILMDRADPASVAAARAAFDDIMAVTLRLGGTCTGEHGVGLLKRDWLAQEIGPVSLRVQRAVKTALDPAGIMNPGKVL
jgi:glycolate oxidase